jgi:phosphatidylglycerophosphatase A
VFIYWLLVGHDSLWSTTLFHRYGVAYAGPLLIRVVEVTLAVSLFGLLAADHVSRETGSKDPQFVVVDEVSGQLLTYLVSLSVANWKYLLVGFILFRVFDIWKPFPARQAEALPGGWGIMADDWVAGIYAGIGLWIARAAGL